MNARTLFALLSLSILSAACEPAEPVDEPGEPMSGEELPIGSIDDLKTDGGWGPALECKPIPDLEPLPNPEIVVSLDGLTLRLFDRSTGFDRVYPIGPGAIEKGISLTPVSTNAPGGVFWARLDKPEVAESKDKELWAWNYSCRMWWKDADSGKSIPVFAGMPFIRLDGPPTAGYGMHGPIDSYTIPSGGKLQRGFVSHGCMRMEAKDIVELYALANGSKVPVRIQKEVERRDDGAAVDIEQRWLLSECAVDADCNFPGGVCKNNPYTGRGYCTAACTKYCNYDKFGYPTSYCVADPEDDEQGICTLKSASLNNGCRRYPGIIVTPGEERFNDASSAAADVCLPGVEGWIGHPCFTDADCLLSGGTCDLTGAAEGIPGTCVLPCAKFCPDKAGYASTFCVTGSGGAGQCAAKCNGPDACAPGTTCTESVPRHGDPSKTADVCLP